MWLLEIGPFSKGAADDFLAFGLGELGISGHP